MVHERNNQPSYTFKKSYITDNDNYVGDYPPAQDSYRSVPMSHLKEFILHKTGKMLLIQNASAEIPDNDLTVIPNTAGSEINAGILKNSKSYVCKGKFYLLVI